MYIYLFISVFFQPPVIYSPLLHGQVTRLQYRLILHRNYYYVVSDSLESPFQYRRRLHQLQSQHLKDDPLDAPPSHPTHFPSTHREDPVSVFRTLEHALVL